MKKISAGHFHGPSSRPGSTKQSKCEKIVNQVSCEKNEKIWCIKIFFSDVAKLQPVGTYHAGDVIGQLVTLPKPVPLPSN